MDDVRSLAVALEEALTGSPAGGPPPSEVVDGLSPNVDRALRQAQGGFLTARALADAFAASPSPTPPLEDPPSWSRRLLLTAAALVIAALALIGLGRLFLAGDASPIILPQPTTPGDPVVPSTTTTTTAPSPDGTAPSVPLAVGSVTSVDPFGGGGEHDDELPLLTDGDPATTWSTETYLDPLPLLKPGVGVAFAVEGTPSRMRVEGITPEVGYVVAWSDSAPPDPGSWERVSSGRTTGADLEVRLPPRQGGRWVLWLTDLPRQAPEDHSAEVGEVRFRS